MNHPTTTKEIPPSLEYEPINLDCDMGPDELAEMSRVYDLLSRYATYRKAAMQERSPDANGSISRALRFEELAECYYRLLPRWAKW